MLKKGPRPVQWALLMYNAQEQQVNGTASIGTIDQARYLARSVLEMLPTVAFILIYACDASGNVASQSITRVDLDEARDE